MLKLFADTDCDMDLRLARELGYSLISMPYTMDGKEIFPYEDFESFEAHDFYQRLREGTMPKTSGLSPEKYVSYFEPVLKAGDDILYVHFTSAMSSTFNAMNIAVQSLKEKYPERTIYALDTKAITSLALAILIEVSKLAKQGKSAEEIIAIAEKDIIPHFAISAFASNLDFFKRSGRLTGMSAFVGKLAGVKPILAMDDEGRLKPIGKKIGFKNAMQALVNDIDTLGDHIEEHPFIIVHSDVPSWVEELKGMILEKHPNLNIQVVYINPTAGVHCGPDCLGVIFHATRRQK